MRILICGDRKGLPEVWPIFKYLESLPRETIIIHGAARGVDTTAGDYAHHLGMKVLAFPAKWSEFGLSAGYKRNQQMLNEGQPDLVVYFYLDLSQSKGTKNMVGLAEKSGLPVLGNPGTPHETRNDAFNTHSGAPGSQDSDVGEAQVE